MLGRQTVIIIIVIHTANLAIFPATPKKIHPKPTVPTPWTLHRPLSAARCPHIKY